MNYTSEQIKKHGELILEWEKNKSSMQYKNHDQNDWYDTVNPTFGFTVDYRIKPKQEYVPFTFEDRELFRGKWVEGITKNEYLILALGEEGVTLNREFIAYDTLLKNFTFLDGSPCGKRKL